MLMYSGADYQAAFSQHRRDSAVPQGQQGPGSADSPPGHYLHPSYCRPYPWTARPHLRLRPGYPAFYSG